MKICKICKIEKELTEFNFTTAIKDKQRTKCKKCQTECSKLYSITNKVKIAAYSKKYRSENHERFKEVLISRRALPENKVKRLLYNASHRVQINKAQSNYAAKRKLETPMFYNAREMRGMMSRKFKRVIGGEINNDRYNKILGCTYRHWVNHITSQFKPGMSLENRSSFELDHIIPISIAVDKEGLTKLHHWTNYQPLSKDDNYKKGIKIMSSSIEESRVKKLNVDSNNYISI